MQEQFEGGKIDSKIHAAPKKGSKSIIIREKSGHQEELEEMLRNIKGENEFAHDFFTMTAFSYLKTNTKKYLLTPEKQSSLLS